MTRVEKIAIIIHNGLADITGDTKLPDNFDITKAAQNDMYMRVMLSIALEVARL